MYVINCCKFKSLKINDHSLLASGRIRLNGAHEEIKNNYLLQCKSQPPIILFAWVQKEIPPSGTTNVSKCGLPPVRQAAGTGTWLKKKMDAPDVPGSKAPPDAWRDSPQVQTQRMSTNWKEAEHQSQYSGWKHQNPCIRRTGQMMTCWVDTSGSWDVMRRRRKKKTKRRSICQEDRHGVWQRQEDHVADKRKTQQELGESGLEEDTDEQTLRTNQQRPGSTTTPGSVVHEQV